MKKFINLFAVLLCASCQDQLSVASKEKPILFGLQASLTYTGVCTLVRFSDATDASIEGSLSVSVASTLGSFFTDSGCTTSATTVPVLDGEVSVYFRSNQSGTATVRIQSSQAKVSLSNSSSSITVYDSSLSGTTTSEVRPEIAADATLRTTSSGYLSIRQDVLTDFELKTYSSDRDLLTSADVLNQVLLNSQPAHALGDVISIGDLSWLLTGRGNLPTVCLRKIKTGSGDHLLEFTDGVNVGMVCLTENMSSPVIHGILSGIVYVQNDTRVYGINSTDGTLTSTDFGEIATGSVISAGRIIAYNDSLMYRVAGPATFGTAGFASIGFGVLRDLDAFQTSISGIAQDGPDTMVFKLTPAGALDLTFAAGAGYRTARASATASKVLSTSEAVYTVSFSGNQVYVNKFSSAGDSVTSFDGDGETTITHAASVTDVKLFQRLSSGMLSVVVGLSNGDVVATEVFP